MSGFAHLHLHTEYSLLDGACRIADIPSAVLEAGQSAVAVTDHGNMFGAVRFYNACKAAGVKPIIGCEVYVANGSRFDRPERSVRPYHHLVLLCKDNTGYKNLSFLVSKGYTEGFYVRPRIDLELLRDHSEGLICLSACMAGYIPQMILNGDISSAEAHAKMLSETFGKGDFYLEIQDHGIDEDAVINGGIRQISEKTGIPMAATNDVHYLKREDAGTQAMLMAISTGKTVEENRSEAFATDQFYLRTESEMRDLFADYPGAVDNCVEIVEKCSVDLDFKGYIFPHIDLEGGEDPDDFLKDLCLKGLDERIGKKEINTGRISLDEYKKRMDYELSVIADMGFSEYFIIVCDFVNYAKNNDIPVGPGRGSGAASLVAFLTGITDVDPLKFGLLFETFLNPQRVSMPDFDIDFHHIKRDKVVEYVKKRYGSDRVSRIIAFGTLGARAAVRDVGRALGVPYSDVDAVAKMIPQTEPGDQSKKMTLKRALEMPEIRRVYDSSEKARTLIDNAMKVEGMPRNVTTHAAGVVISDKAVSEYSPVAVSGGEVVTQFDMDSVSAIGLLKFDFLGLRELTTIETCVEKIREVDADFDITKIPEDDRETFELLSRGDTIGVFQLESAGMRRMLCGLKPNSLNDLMLALALYRPGATKFIDTLIENRQNGVKDRYRISGTAEILKETYGCIVYSEQVIQILRAVAGYSFGEADVVSRAIKKKKHEVIESERNTFISGAVAKGAKESDAQRLFDDIEGFSKYGFKKSHAAAYGIISYRTAYLKAHYPAFYFSSIMSTELGETKSVVKYIEDAEHFGIKLMVPDINESDIGFTVTPEGNIRYGLLALKNVGANYAAKIVSERKQRPFSGFTDFVKRIAAYDPGKKQIESLIKSGAFDSFGETRHTLLSSYEEIVDLAAKKNRSELDGQLDIFSTVEDDDMYHLTKFPEFDLSVLLLYEKEVSGMYMSAHPIDKYDSLLSKFPHSPISSVTDVDDEDENVLDHSSAVLAGIISSVTVKDSKSGKMAFVTIEDRTGSIEAIVFSELYKRSIEYLVADEGIALDGEITTREGEAPKILAKSIRSFRELSSEKENSQRKTPAKEPEHNGVRDAVPQKIFLRVPSLDSPEWKKANAIINIFGGSTRVIVFDKSESKYSAISNKGVTADEFVVNELKNVLGEDSVVLQ